MADITDEVRDKILARLAANPEHLADLLKRLEESLREEPVEIKDEPK